MIVFVYHLAKGLKEKRPLLYVIGMLLRLVNLIILLVLISKATKTLKANGFKVGLMGADLGKIEA